MLDCFATLDCLLAPPWILESTPQLSCAGGDKPVTSSSKPKSPPDLGMKSGGSHLGAISSGKIGLEEEDGIFGSPRGYGTSFRSGRPTMISPKYRQKEERRKVLKISINKLKKIEDPESSLRRSVLINNTMKRLQREAREEKFHKQQSIASGYSRCFGVDFLKDDENTAEPVTVQPAARSPADQLVDITNLPEVKAVSLAKTASSVMTGIEDCLGCDESMPDVVESALSVAEESPAERGAGGRKRSYDDVDDCDVQDVLSQFYMPPTPRMLTSIDDDEDEDVNVVDIDTPGEKRPRLDEPSAADRLKNMTRSSHQTSATSDLEHRLTMAASGSDVISERCPSPGGAPFSCGHSSMFSELQSVVYHSLIASLET